MAVWRGHSASVQDTWRVGEKEEHRNPRDGGKEDAVSALGGSYSGKLM